MHFRWLLLLLLILPVHSDPVRLRILAGNLTSGNQQSYDPGQGARILQGLHPDVALLQEFRCGDNTPLAAEAWVKAVWNPSVFFFREERELPNGIVSTYPLLASGSWDDPEQTNRDFAWARIDLPGPHKLLAVSVHLSAKNSTKREHEAKALSEAVRAARVDGDFLVIGGDFNAQNRTDPALTGLRDLVVTTSPYPADESGNDKTNHKRTSPYDGVYTDPELQALGAPTLLGGSEVGLVFDSRVYSDLTRVTPVQKDDSDALQMQHMAVVRDFILK